MRLWGEHPYLEPGVVDHQSVTGIQATYTPTFEGRNTF
jgi:hypothetical protein